MDYNKYMLGRKITKVEWGVGILVLVVVISALYTFYKQTDTQRRDAQRIEDMIVIAAALDRYAQNNAGEYPEEESSGDTWEKSYEDNGAFLDVLVREGYLGSRIVDPVNNEQYHYRYHYYGPETAELLECGFGAEHFYILGVKSFESVQGTHPESPGFACPKRDWHVIGGDYAWAQGKSQPSGAAQGM